MTDYASAVNYVNPIALNEAMWVVQNNPALLGAESMQAYNHGLGGDLRTWVAWEIANDPAGTTGNGSVGYSHCVPDAANALSAYGLGVLACASMPESGPLGAFACAMSALGVFGTSAQAAACYGGNGY